MPTLLVAPDDTLADALDWELELAAVAGAGSGVERVDSEGVRA